MHTAQHVNIHDKYQFHVSVAMETKMTLKVKHDDVSIIVKSLFLLVIVITFELCHLMLVHRVSNCNI